jgi:hypothetical protein
MAEFFKVLSAVLPVFLIALLGFQLRRMDWLTKAADDSLLMVSVNVLLPCLAFSNISNNPELLKPENVWLPPVIGFLSIGVGMAVGWLVRKFATGSTDAKGRTFAISIGVFNFGFVPIPLVGSLFGESAVGVLFVFNVGTLLAMWSLGVMLLHGDLRTGLRKAINVPVVTVVAALVVNATGLHGYIPVLANDTINTLGLCGIPMSILLIGAMVKDHFAECDFRSSFRVCWVSVVLRLGLLPLGMIALAKWLPCSTELRQVLLVAAAMPSAIFPLLIARLYGGSPVVATQVAIVTTLVSLGTIPLWLRAGAAFIGLDFE